LAETIVPVTTRNVHIKRKARNLFMLKTLLELLPVVSKRPTANIIPHL